MTNQAIARELGTHTDKGPLAAALRGRGDQGIEQRSVPGVATTGGGAPKAQAALRTEIIRRTTQEKAAGRDALAVPVNGEGGGHDAQLREHGVAVGGA